MQPSSAVDINMPPDSAELTYPRFRNSVDEQDDDGGGQHAAGGVVWVRR